MSDSQRLDYERRVNRAMDYITRHLSEPIRLEDLAREAAFSPYHFHRIFSALVGETVSAFIRRVRLEQAASDLVTFRRKSITEIALDSGFGSSAVFARAFRARFGMSAGEWRARGRNTCTPDRKEDQTDRNAGQEAGIRPRYALPWWVSRDAQTNQEDAVEVKLEEMPAIRALYVRRMGDYNVSANHAWAALCQWAGPRGLLGPDTMYFSISYDDPEVTEPGKLRYDACIAVGPEAKPEGEVGVVELPARRVARGRYEGPAPGIAKAWRALYAEWLPGSGFAPGDSPAIEVYLPNEGNNPEKDHFVMDICIPVVAA